MSNHISDSPELSADLVNTTVDGRFLIEALIGEGASGKVYRAQHTLMGGRPVAVKVLNALNDSRALERFRREIQAISSLDHPNIVKPLACGALADGRAYFVMEYVDGISLDLFIKQHGSLSQRCVAEIGAQVAEALQSAHEHGILHRDVSPRNIVVCKSGERIRARVLDFGISAFIDNAGGQAQTTTGCKGSPHYMSPEQCLQKPADARSDIYSLGCVLFHATTGRTPYEAESAFEVMYKHAHEPVPEFRAIRGLNARFRAAIISCMQKDPASRFQSMEELQRRLADIVSDLPEDRLDFVSTRKAFRQFSLGFWVIVVLCFTLCSIFVSLNSERAFSNICLAVSLLKPEAERSLFFEQQALFAEKHGLIADAADLMQVAASGPQLQPLRRLSLNLRAADLLRVKGDEESAQVGVRNVWRDVNRRFRAEESGEAFADDAERSGYAQLAWDAFLRSPREELLPAQLHFIARQIGSPTSYMKSMSLVKAALANLRRTGSRDNGSRSGCEDMLSSGYLDKAAKSADATERDQLLELSRQHLQEAMKYHGQTLEKDGGSMYSRLEGRLACINKVLGSGENPEVILDRAWKRIENHPDARNQWSFAKEIVDTNGCFGREFVRKYTRLREKYQEAADNLTAAEIKNSRLERERAAQTGSD